MIRRLLRALDRDHAVSALAVTAVLTALLFGYGDRQQHDEQAQSTLTTCEGCGKTVVVAKE